MRRIQNSENFGGGFIFTGIYTNLLVFFLKKTKDKGKGSGGWFWAENADASQLCWRSGQRGRGGRRPKTAHRARHTVDQQTWRRMVHGRSTDDGLGLWWLSPQWSRGLPLSEVHSALIWCTSPGGAGHGRGGVGVLMAVTHRRARRQWLWRAADIAKGGGVILEWRRNAMMVPR